ncbi:UDP-glucose 4-epimerase [Nocardioides zeae]|uniref:UDP-glucose 4-epimerase n=2 Tax=Nocardioides zeae TaxID=1457234 RepID=A0ACC6IIT6_9ACTN|nr:UDP-glucose 4-epimerase GalE [Nocardioides zeae]MDQ1105846.1 UDP-glucose 4-epimerase [Nocardioides zeae]MDR6174508.1 UDP-glucose 4-epimerase [Nocardioides zeae]MDR6210580.1 UDP-glucose 4-epimerase [Nocardioides zeae]
MRILVAGGAGYIGSHTVLSLLEAGHDVVVADDFSNARPAVLDRMRELAGAEVPFVEVDLTDAARTEALVADRRPDAVIHFAGLKAVGESAVQPLRYYRTNLDATFSLLEAMGRHGVERFVFSSSATVYGDHAPVPYVETYAPLAAASPYGRTKVMTEQVLNDHAAATPGLRVALLRYFNPVGAHPSGRMGEDPQGVPNNLMPYVAQVAVGRQQRLAIFGDDYDTPDGTCLRDYIHVVDLAEGHVAALEHLDEQATPVRAFNLGGGRGTSVRELFDAFCAVVGRELPHEVVGRRPGDLPAYWADTTRAADELGWTARRSLDDMVADVWRWQSQNPTGYPA